MPAPLPAQDLSLALGSVTNDAALGEQLFTLDSGLTRGFRFDVTGSVYVAGLAVFDLGSDGWTGQPSTTVSLWRESDLINPVLTLEVAPDAPLFGAASDFGDFGQFRTATTTPFLLSAGAYRVTADMADIETSGVADFLILPKVQTITAATGITVVDAVNGTSLATTRHAYLGGNVLLSSIPEPSTYALVLAALVGAVTLSKRFRR